MLELQLRRTIDQSAPHTVTLTVLVITQERVSFLYTGHAKEPEGTFEKELGTSVYLCIRFSLKSDGFHHKVYDFEND